MNVRSGFFVVEFLMYFLLFSCLSSFLMHFVVSSSLRLKRASERTISVTSLLTALDCVATELQQAPSDVRLWKKKEPSLVVWHADMRNSDVGIALVKDRVWRIEGSYSLFKDAWVKKKKSLLATHIKELNFSYQQYAVHGKKQIGVIDCSLKGLLSTTDEYAVSKSVLLENRMLPL